VKLGIAVPQFDVETKRTLGLAEMAAFARRAEELGFDSVWVMDHYWLDNVGGLTGGHDPFVTLSYVAARTESITLGTLVACNGFRAPGQLAREASALADAASGRLILGVGSGWEESEFKAFDYDFDHRVGRLEETLQVVPALLDGERVSFDGRFVSLRDAFVLTTAPPPPVWIASFTPRLMGLAGRYAAGWNTAWHGADPQARFIRELAALREAIAAAGRRPDEVTISVGLWLLPVSGAELEDAERRATSLKKEDAPANWPQPLAERMVTGELDDLERAVRAYLDAGAEHVILNPSVTPFSLFDASYLERASGLVARLRD